MSASELNPGQRVKDVRFGDDKISVDLLDGRTITVPLAWYPRLLIATPAQRAQWQISGRGYAIHWPQIDEDLSTEGLLRGASAPRQSASAPGKAGGRGARRAYTPRQGQCLAFISHYIKIHKRPPAEADIAAFLGISPPSAHAMVVALEGRGLIKRTPGESRSIRLLIPREDLPGLE